MYTDGKPEGVLKGYLDWVVTHGQKQVLELGFVPLKTD
jgi:ABC-type phosphate transport system substrate-binding protein